MMDQLTTANGALEHKTLEAPVQLAQMAANMELDEHEIKSVWTRERDDALVRNDESDSDKEQQLKEEDQEK